MADIDYALTFILKHVRAANEKRGVGRVGTNFSGGNSIESVRKRKKKGERQRENIRGMIVA